MDHLGLVRQSMDPINHGSMYAILPPCRPTEGRRPGPLLCAEVAWEEGLKEGCRQGFVRMAVRSKTMFRTAWGQTCFGVCSAIEYVSAKFPPIFPFFVPVLGTPEKAAVM